MKAEVQKPFENTGCCFRRNDGITSRGTFSEIAKKADRRAVLLIGAIKYLQLSLLSYSVVWLYRVSPMKFSHNYT